MGGSRKAKRGREARERMGVEGDGRRGGKNKESIALGREGGGALLVDSLVIFGGFSGGFSETSSKMRSWI